ncbi:Uncharacterised protein [Candidatus Anstonella stagnisolia]|nr:Uncharacterised protein [Candidatus Anstonella stagnisolia]
MASGNSCIIVNLPKSDSAGPMLPPSRTPMQRLDIKFKGLHLINSQCEALKEQARAAHGMLARQAGSDADLNASIWESVALLDELPFPHPPDSCSRPTLLVSRNFSINLLIETLDNAATRRELALDFLAGKIQSAKTLLFSALAKMSASLPFAEEVRSASQELLEAISR